MQGLTPRRWNSPKASCAWSTPGSCMFVPCNLAYVAPTSFVESAWCKSPRPPFTKMEPPSPGDATICVWAAPIAIFPVRHAKRIRSVAPAILDTSNFSSPFSTPTRSKPSSRCCDVYAFTAPGSWRPRTNSPTKTTERKRY